MLYFALMFLVVGLIAGALNIAGVAMPALSQKDIRARGTRKLYVTTAGFSLVDSRRTLEFFMEQVAFVLNELSCRAEPSS